MTLDQLKERHNTNARTLAESYEKSAAHAAFMSHQALSIRDRSKWERRRDKDKRKALEARKTIIA